MWVKGVWIGGNRRKRKGSRAMHVSTRLRKSFQLVSYTVWFGEVNNTAVIEATYVTVHSQIDHKTSRIHANRLG